MSDLLERMASIKTTKNYCNGMVSIGFRTDQACYNINDNNFELNFSKDGWFRKNYGPAKNHGLCINKFSITSSKPVFCGDFSCYKAKIDYTDNDFDSTEKQDLFWVYCHKNIDIKSVVEYIHSTKHEWKP